MGIRLSVRLCIRMCIRLCIRLCVRSCIRMCIRWCIRPCARMYIGRYALKHMPEHICMCILQRQSYCCAPFSIRLGVKECTCAGVHLRGEAGKVDFCVSACARMQKRSERRGGLQARCPPICVFRSFVVAPSRRLKPLSTALGPKRLRISSIAPWILRSLSSAS